MTFSTRNFDPLTPLAPKFGYTNIVFFSLETHCGRRHTCTCATKFYTTWVRGVACQKQRLGPKLEGAGLGEYPKIWDPCISATVEASNFKFGTQLGFGTSLTKNNVLDQNWRGCGPGEHPKKIWDPLRFFATVEASNFKFSTLIGFGTSLSKNDV